MRPFYCFVLITLLGCTENVAEYDLVVSNVTLIDGSGAPVRSGVSVAVTDGVIKEITSAETISARTVIDGTDKYLMPGLIDGHAHSSNHEYDFARFVHYGVTSIFVPGGSTTTNEVYASMRRLGAQDSLPAPRVYHTSQHFTMEGRHPVKTYANSNWVEGSTVFYLRDTTQISELVRQVARFPISGIKLTIEDGPAPPFVERIPQEFINKTVVEAAKSGLEVFAHVSDNEEFLMAVDGGAQNIIHFVGVDIDWDNDTHVAAVNTLVERESSIVTTLMIDKSFVYVLHPEWMEVPAFNAAYPEDELKRLITPEAVAKANRVSKTVLAEYGMTLETLYQPQVDDIKILLEMGLNVVLGTDAGNDFNFHGYSMHEEMQLMEMGGISPIDIVKMGTLNGAKMIGVSDSLGTIEVGKYADMILLDQNPIESISNTLTISVVVKNGIVQSRLTD